MTGSTNYGGDGDGGGSGGGDGGDSGGGDGGGSGGGDGGGSGSGGGDDAAAQVRGGNEGAGAASTGDNFIDSVLMMRDTTYEPELGYGLEGPTRVLRVAAPAKQRFRRRWLAALIQRLVLPMGGARARPLLCDPLALRPRSRGRSGGLALAPPAAADGEQVIIDSMVGLHIGDFGPHGIEILHLRQTADGLVCGLKVTGDPNVPAGRLSFVTTGPLVPTDGGEEEESFLRCDCIFGCACFSAAERRSVTIIGAAPAVAKTAMSGYRGHR